MLMLQPVAEHHPWLYFEMRAERLPHICSQAATKLSAIFKIEREMCLPYLIF